MLCDSVHEFYYSPERAKTAREPRRLNGRSQAGLSSAGTDSILALMCADDLEEHFDSVHSARLSASAKLRAALKTQMYPPQIAVVAAMQQDRPRTLWTDADMVAIQSACPSRRTSSIQDFLNTPVGPPKAPVSCLTTKRLHEDTGQVVQARERVVIRDNTMRGNEWISECTPKVWLFAEEREIWVQRRDTERKRWKERSQVLKSCKARAMPFDQWLHVAKQSEEFADEEDFIDDKGTPAEVKTISAKGKAPQTKDYRYTLINAAGLCLDALRLDMKEKGVANWQQCFDKLCAEYTNGYCDIVRNPTNATIERVVNIVALRLEAREGSPILVQLGCWSHGKVLPKCLLPGAKMVKGELVEDAAHRLLKQGFSPFAGNVKIGSCRVLTHWRDSPSFGIRTKYVRSIVSGKLEVDPSTLNVMKATLKVNAPNIQDLADKPVVGSQTFLEQRRGNLRRKTDSDGRTIGASSRKAKPGHRPQLPVLAQCHAKTIPIDMKDMYLLWHGDDIDLCTFLLEDEFDHLRSPAGERQLKNLLATFIVDPTAMPPKTGR